MKEELYMKTQGPVRATRLHTQGARSNDKPRPIKLEFIDEHNKWEFLKRANANMRSAGVFCKLDESKETRDLQYTLQRK